MQHELTAKKIRENLLSQKQRLTEYLQVLGCESQDIRDKDADKLQLHIQRANQILSELRAFKKISEPLEKMYSQSPYQKDDSLNDLRGEIMKLTETVRQKSEENKRALDDILGEMQTQISSAPKRALSKDAYSASDTRFIDISL